MLRFYKTRINHLQCTVVGIANVLLNIISWYDFKFVFVIESRNRDRIKTKTLKLELLNLSMNWTEIIYRIRWYVISMYYIYNNY